MAAVGMGGGPPASGRSGAAAAGGAGAASGEPTLIITDPTDGKRYRVKIKNLSPSLMANATALQKEAGKIALLAAAYFKNPSNTLTLTVGVPQKIDFAAINLDTDSLAKAKAVFEGTGAGTTTGITHAENFGRTDPAAVKATIQSEAVRVADAVQPVLAGLGPRASVSSQDIDELLIGPPAPSATGRSGGGGGGGGGGGPVAGGGGRRGDRQVRALSPPLSVSSTESIDGDEDSVIAGAAAVSADPSRPRPSPGHPVRSADHSGPRPSPGPSSVRRSGGDVGGRGGTSASAEAAHPSVVAESYINIEDIKKSLTVTSEKLDQQRIRVEEIEAVLVDPTEGGINRVLVPEFQTADGIYKSDRAIGANPHTLVTFRTGNTRGRCYPANNVKLGGGGYSYIQAEAPMSDKPGSKEHYYQMALESGSELLVSVSTGFKREGSTVKVHLESMDMLKPGETLRIGDATITCDKQEETVLLPEEFHSYAKYNTTDLPPYQLHVRTLTVTKPGEAPRQIMQIVPDFVPVAYPFSLSQWTVDQVANIAQSKCLDTTNYPVIVNCNTGRDRSGQFIILDSIRRDVTALQNAGIAPQDHLGSVSDLLRFRAYQLAEQSTKGAGVISIDKTLLPNFVREKESGTKGDQRQAILNHYARTAGRTSWEEIGGGGSGGGGGNRRVPAHSALPDGAALAGRKIPALTPASLLSDTLFSRSPSLASSVPGGEVREEGGISHLPEGDLRSDSRASSSFSQSFRSLSPPPKSLVTQAPMSPSDFRSLSRGSAAPRPTSVQSVGPLPGPIRMARGELVNRPGSAPLPGTGGSGAFHPIPLHSDPQANFRRVPIDESPRTSPQSPEGAAGGAASLNEAPPHADGPGGDATTAKTEGSAVIPEIPARRSPTSQPVVTASSGEALRSAAVLPELLDLPPGIGIELELLPNSPPPPQKEEYDRDWV